MECYFFCQIVCVEIQRIRNSFETVVQVRHYRIQSAIMSYYLTFSKINLHSISLCHTQSAHYYDHIFNSISFYVYVLLSMVRCSFSFLTLPLGRNALIALETESLKIVFCFSVSQFWGFLVLLTFLSQNKSFWKIVFTNILRILSSINRKIILMYY